MCRQPTHTCQQSLKSTTSTYTSVRGRVIIIGHFFTYESGNETLSAEVVPLRSCLTTRMIHHSSSSSTVAFRKALINSSRFRRGRMHERRMPCRPRLPVDAH